MDRFKELKVRLLSIGFREVTAKEGARTTFRLDFVPPRRKLGGEARFVYQPNNSEYRVIVYTTFLERFGKEEEEDLGWVLIAKGDDKVPYFTHPMRRTENFLENLARYAWITKWKVDNRPVCEQCKNDMEIARGKGLGSRYWICRNRHLHKGRQTVRKGWDYGMENMPKSIAFLTAKRKARVPNYEKNRAAGKPIQPARLKRKLWGKRNLHNVR